MFDLGLNDMIMIGASFFALIFSILALFCAIRYVKKNGEDEIEDYRHSRASTYNYKDKEEDETYDDDEDNDGDGDDDYDYIAHCITVYGSNGEVIRKFQGELKVIEENPDTGYIYFEDETTLQHSISGNFGIIVDLPK